MDAIKESRPQHKWSLEQRQLLCLLWKVYQVTWTEITAIMTDVLAEQLKAEGFLAGLPETTLKAQFNEMRREGSSGYETLRTICVDLSISEARKQYRELRDQIEDSACSIGISLHLKVEENQEIGLLKGPRHTRRKRLWHDKELGDENSEDDGLEGVLTHFVSSDSETDSGTLHSKCKKRFYSENTGCVTPTKATNAQLPSPNSDRSGISTPRTGQKGRTNITRGKTARLFQRVGEIGNKLQKPPRLLYRWYSSQSQGLNTATHLRAGKFVNAPCSIPAPKWDVEAVSNHLIPEKKLSPYISFRDTLRGCLFYALKADANSNACITIIDLQQFLTASRQRRGDDGAARYCPSLVNQFGLKLGRSGTYIGSGEWLLYGTVEREAIVTTVRISDILMHVRSTPRLENVLQIDTLSNAPTGAVAHKRLWISSPTMDFQVGEAVGSFAKFLRIPQAMLEPFAAKLAFSWRLKGSFYCDKKNKMYEAFLNGVFSIEGVGKKSQVLNDNTVEPKVNDEESNDANLSDTIEVSPLTPPDEQDLIDIQLQRELSSDLKRSYAALEEATTTSVNTNDERVSNHQDQNLDNDHIDGTAHSTLQSRVDQPTSSRLFHFERPQIPGPPTNWDAVNSRDVSPAPTERSALDTFTTELLAKAEEYSTIGSFGRGPSASTRREASEVQMVTRTRRETSEIQILTGPLEEENGQKSMERPVENVLPEGPDIIDLLSDDDEGDDDVEEMDFCILAARRSGHDMLGGLLRADTSHRQAA